MHCCFIKMDLHFARNDLLQTATTQRGTLVVLPLSNGKKQQKARVEWHRQLSCMNDVATRFCAFPKSVLAPDLNEFGAVRGLQVGVGDSDGILQVFGAKQRGETVETFRTAPTGSQASSLRKLSTSVQT